MASTFTKLKATAFVYGEAWSLVVGERTRQSLTALAFREFDLGGSRNLGIDGTGEQDAAEFKYVVLPGADLQGFTAQVRYETWTANAGTSVTPKILDMTLGAGNYHAVGAAVTATSPTEEVVSFTMPNATRKLKFVLTKSNSSALVYGVAKIELLTP